MLNLSRQLLALLELSCCDLGRTYRSEEVNIDEPTGNKESSLVTDQYLDRNGRMVASAPAYSAATEYAYDGAGRRYQSRTVIDLETTRYSGTGSFQYRSPVPDHRFSSTNSTAMSGGNDQVLAFNHRVLDSAGNENEIHKFEANHNDADGLDLTGNNDYVRTSTYLWYDNANRRTERADYGSCDTATGAGSWKYASIPSRPSSAPTQSSDLVKVAKRTYTTKTARPLHPSSVADAKGFLTWFLHDDAGRLVYRGPAYLPSLGSTPQKGSVIFTYNGADLVTKIEVIEDDWPAPEQETTYLYGDTYIGSLPTSVTYPDSGSVAYSYNLDGTVKSKTDQRGTVIDFTYKFIGERRLLEWEKATTLGTDVDDHVRSLFRAYNPSGRVYLVRSYAETSGGVVRNEVYHYYDRDRLEVSRQSHEGPTTSNSPTITYTLDQSADASGVYDNGLRLRRVRYPTSTPTRHVKFFFDSTINDRLHRPDRLWLNMTGVNHDLAKYQYNGTRRVVATHYQPTAFHSRLDEADGDGVYEKLDRFGRIKSKDWRTTAIVKDQFDYTHDYVNNRLTRDIPASLYAANDRDQQYTYHNDNNYGHVLTNVDEGTLSGTSIPSPKFEQDWSLTTTGNWVDLTEKTNGSTTLSQSRDHNVANEITEIDSITTHVEHDAAGNMTKVPKPASWSSHYDLTYDAWNRLVKVEDGAATVAEYEYDGLNRRIVKTVGSDVYHYYYNKDWQVVEVYKDGVTNAIEQYVWHPYYIDALAARYHDANEDGDYTDTNETQYFTHDANFNVTGVLDSAGNVIERYAYSPYGKMTVLDADFSVDSDGKSDVANPYTYTGRRFDEETGLYYYRNRYYHGQLGRFVSRDPTGYFGSKWNLYEYASTNPAVLLDPMGTAVYTPQSKPEWWPEWLDWGGDVESFDPSDFANPMGIPAGVLSRLAGRAWKRVCRVGRRISISVRPRGLSTAEKAALDRAKNICGGDCEHAAELLSQAIPGGNKVRFSGDKLLHEAYEHGGRVYDITAGQYVRPGLLSVDDIAKAGLTDALQTGVFTLDEHAKFMDLVKEALK